MRAKATFTLLAMLFAVVLALAIGSVFAQQNPQSKQSSDPSSQATTKEQTVSGSVVSVDSTNKTLSIKDDQGNSHTINVDTNTKIQSAGKSADLSDIKAGDHIVATVKSEAGRMIASSIDVHKGGKSPKSETTSSPYGTTSDKDRRSDTATSGTTSPSYGTTSERDRAGATTGTTGTTSSVYGRGQSLSGQVVSVDPANNSLVLQDDQGQSHTIKVDSSTSFRSDSGVSLNNLSDLKAGDRIVANMKADDNTMASSIRKTTAGTAAAETTTRTPSRTSRETTRTPSRTSRETTSTTSDMASTSDVSGRTGQLPRTATPLPLIGVLGLLVLSAGAIVRKIVG